MVAAKKYHKKISKNHQPRHSLRQQVFHLTKGKASRLVHMAETTHEIIMNDGGCFTGIKLVTVVSHWNFIQNNAIGNFFLVLFILWIEKFN